MSENYRKVYYIFSPFLRIFHWIMVLCIITLFFTGLYITKPISGGVNGEPTFGAMVLSLNMIRNIHFLAAFTLTASFILKIYGFIVNKGDRLFPRVWEKSFWLCMMDVSLHYMLIQPTHKSYLRNSLARMSYVALYLMILVEILTGFAMYLMVNPNGMGAFLFGWINPMVGGEFTVHLIHHYVAWLIVLSAIGHVYMVIRSEFMEGEGEVSSMFSGVKALSHEPVDIGEIIDKKTETVK
ncbi:Ni/Fe-hydrogenase, b-type cytochrome subunit [Propionispira raffinosivorans]|uniref:Ni/Fe-hydrogenase, b-type cytochrome subunit n=1 Tax=Propionispira raffinosivorans TaxID=86959 RepID=UPI00035FD1CC|nr:Ni/Fe-hydrogenase, b-type cytochrome subunit [Propionispira raffinosivorans]